MNRYPYLPVLASVYRIVAALSVVGAVAMVLGGFASESGAAVLSGFVYLLVVPVTCLAVSDLITLALSVEERSRDITRLLGIQLQVQTRDLPEVERTAIRKMVDELADTMFGAGAAPGERKCPDCAEVVKVAAKVCKHCGARFDAPKVEA